MSFLIVMVLLLVVMYVLMIRPQRQRQREQQSMIDGAGVGDDIVVEIAENVTVHMTRKGIAAVLPPEEEDEEEAEGDVVDSDEAEELVENDEALVTTGEAAVTSDVEGDAAASERR